MMLVPAVALGGASTPQPNTNIAVASPLMVPPSRQSTAPARTSRGITAADTSWQVDFTRRGRSSTAASLAGPTRPTPVAHSQSFVAPPRRAELWPGNATRVFQYHQMRPFQYQHQQHQPAALRLSPSWGYYAVPPPERGIEPQSAARFQMNYSGVTYGRHPPAPRRPHWDAAGERKPVARPRAPRRVETGRSSSGRGRRVQGSRTQDKSAQASRTQDKSAQANRTQGNSPAGEASSSSQPPPAISTAPAARRVTTKTEESKTEQPRHVCEYCGKTFIQVSARARVPFRAHRILHAQGSDATNTGRQPEDAYPNTHWRKAIPVLCVRTGLYTKIKPQAAHSDAPA